MTVHMEHRHDWPGKHAGAPSPLRAVFALALVAGLSGCLEPIEKGGPRVDSVTHFLRACVNDAQCPEELSCLCGVCTVACEDDAPCGAESAKATCLPSTSLAACGVLSPQGAASICAIPCAADPTCDDLSCGLGRCYASPDCPEGFTYDELVGHCAGPWTEIPSFSGDQGCGPEYRLIELPTGMNEFRPRAPSVVTGGFLNAISNPEQQILWSISPNGETNVCNHLWGDDLGTWFQGIRRTAGDIEAHCEEPRVPPPLAFFFRLCGIYDFSLEGRAIIPPLF